MRRETAEVVPSESRRMPISPQRAKTLGRDLALGFLILCAAWYVRENILEHIPDSGPSDFAGYYLAAGKILHGESPYSVGVYIYPPALSFLLTPLALLDYLTARRIWFLLSQACLAAAALVTWRHGGRSLRAGCVIALVWAGGGAAAEDLEIGQMGAILTLLLAWFYARQGRRQGAAAGLGVALKLIPGLMGVALLLRRDWRALTAMLVVAAVLVAAPWMAVSSRLSGPHGPEQQFLGGTPNILSWSVPSVALRALTLPRNGSVPYNWLYSHDWRTLVPSRRHRAIATASAMLTGIAGVLMLGAAVRWKLSSEQTALAGAALLSLTLAILPVSWSYYQEMQYPGLALLLCHAARFRQWKLFTAGLAAGTCLYRVPVAVLEAAWSRHHAWSAPPGFLFFWTSVPGAACLVLFGLFLAALTAARVRPSAGGHLAD